MGAKVDITGQKFGMLTAIEPTDQRKNKKIVWRCRCDCGREVFVTAKELRAGKTQTCGKHGREDLTGQRFGRLTALYLLQVVCVVFPGVKETRRGKHISNSRALSTTSAITKTLRTL